MYKLVLVCLMNAATPWCAQIPTVEFSNLSDCQQFLASHFWEKQTGHRTIVCQDEQASPEDKLRQAVDAVKDGFK